MHALVTGGTGFIGHRLLAKLEQPVVVSRNAVTAAKKLEPLKPKVLRWNPMTEPLPASALGGIDTIFHLAGDPVAAGRWTEKKKQRIRDSRVIGTQSLVAGLAAAAIAPPPSATTAIAATPRSTNAPHLATISSPKYARVGRAQRWVPAIWASASF
jgi:uncharacterized protein